MCSSYSISSNNAHPLWDSIMASSSESNLVQTAYPSPRYAAEHFQHSDHQPQIDPNSSENEEKFLKAENEPILTPSTSYSNLESNTSYSQQTNHCDTQISALNTYTNCNYNLGYNCDQQHQRNVASGSFFNPDEAYNSKSPNSMASYYQTMTTSGAGLSPQDHLNHPHLQGHSPHPGTSSMAKEHHNHWLKPLSGRNILLLNWIL